MGTAKLPSLPAGAPVGAAVRAAREVPSDTWVAPVAEAAVPLAWRPAIGRTTTAEYVVFIHTRAAPGRASEYTKFPRGVWLVWCRGKPKFPAPAPVEVQP